jgi:hypothetical protein
MSRYTDYNKYYETQLSRTSFADNVRRQQAINKGTIVDLQTFNPDNDASIVTVLAEGALFTTGAELADYLGILPPSAPDKPFGLVAIPRDSALQISFSGGSNARNFLYSTDGNIFTPLNPAQLYSPITVSGLTNGLLYSISLKAINDIGSSLASSPVTGIPISFPQPPQSLTSSLANSAIYIDFVPGSNGGTPITNYEISINGVTFSPFSPPTSSSPLYITGLANGTTYTIYVRAINAIGSSLTSANITATPATNPSEPTSLRVTPGNTLLSLSFTPGFNGGAIITNYEYSINGSPYTPLSPPQTTPPLLFNGLTNGVSYTISLKALNFVGESPASSSVTGIPARVPDPPTSLVATPSNASISISFIPGANNGNAILNYQYSLDGSNYTVFSPAVTVSPVRISGLSNGTLYTIYLEAINSVGSSFPSAPVSANPATLPSPPTALVATPSNAQIIVSFSNGDTGGRDITNYQYSLDGSNYALFSPPITSSPAIVTGLSNGTSYSVYLKAVTSFGSSIPAGPVTANPVTLPSPPTALVATPSNAQIRISFSNADTGGRAITNYEYSLDGSNYALFSPPITSSPVIVTGLSNGTSYSVYLQAVTSFGSSTPAGPVTAIPVTLPSPPTALVATPSNAQISISFSNGDTGGTPITNYRYSTDGSNYALFSPPITSSPAIVTGLSNGTLYTVYLKAVNAVGTSIGFASASANPVTYPSPPTALVATPSNAQIRISFSNADTGGRAITNYEYSLDGSTYSLFSPAITSSPVIVTGLSNGTSYSVYLQAVTSFGSSTPAGPVTAIPVTLPSPPTALVATPSNAQISISFSNGDTGGTPITNYRYSTDGSNYALFSPAVTSSPAIVTGLSNGTLYTVYLKAVNAVGTSTDFASVSATPARVPDAPTSLFAAIQDSSLLISFTSGSNGGSAITNYQYSLDGTIYTPFSPAVPTSPVEVTGLSNGISYTVYLAAINSMGAGAAASVTQTPNPPIAPDPPTELAVIPADSSLTIPFTEGFNGRTPITNYSYSTDGTTFTPLSPEQASSPVTVSGLSNGIVYTLYLKAINGAGSSIASSPITASPIPASFAPTSISGANLWLNSLSPSSVIVSGSNVTAWNDTSGSGNNFTASGGTIKYGGTGQINNRPALYFTTGLPTVTRLTRTFTLSPQSLTLFMVVSQTGVSGNSNSLLFGSSNSNKFTLQNLTTTSSNLSFSVGTLNNNTQSNIVKTPPSAAVISLIISYTTGGAVYINSSSTAVSTANVGNITLNESTLWSISGTGFIGNIGEIISYPSVLSNDNRQKVEAYLAWKWGIQSDLNSSNFWKNVPPSGETAPGAPTLLYVLAGNSNIYVFYTPASGNIINYQYAINSGQPYITLTSNITSPVIIPNLINSNSVNIALRAFNGGGFGTPSPFLSYTVLPLDNSFSAANFLVDPTDSNCYSGSGSNVRNIGTISHTGGTIIGSIGYGTGSGISNNVFKMNGGYMSFQTSGGGVFNFLVITAWIYPSTSNLGINSIIGGVTYNLGWSNTSLVFATNVNVSPIVYTISASNVIVPNRWQHVSVIIDQKRSSNAIVLFTVNGNLVSSGNTITGQLFTGGSRFFTSSYLFNAASNAMYGELGLVKIFINFISAGPAFTISQVINDFNATRSNFGV